MSPSVTIPVSLQEILDIISSIRAALDTSAASAEFMNAAISSLVASAKSKEALAVKYFCASTTARLCDKACCTRISAFAIPCS